MIDIDELTSVQQINNMWFKRDDLANNSHGIVTAGSRHSPQCQIAAHISKYLGITCRLHMPSGQYTAEMRDITEQGGVIVQHKPGYNTVIIDRAKKDAVATGLEYVPFGMECQESIEQTSKQVANIPDTVKRIVIPVGSGMQLAGVLHGLVEYGKKIPVLGVVVGADPIKRLNKYAPVFWQQMVELVTVTIDYSVHIKNNIINNIELDPVYEAKCLPYLTEGDLLWIVGKRSK
jgi:1-aminocyclopropane-1-carboxylate deaminase/D-cysteine desulfhydrase-like pyridoxal-dependent ACC family enzyme